MPPARHGCPPSSKKSQPDVRKLETCTTLQAMSQMQRKRWESFSKCNSTNLQSYGNINVSRPACTQNSCHPFGRLFSEPLFSQSFYEKAILAWNINIAGITRPSQAVLQKSAIPATVPLGGTSKMWPVMACFHSDLAPFPPSWKTNFFRIFKDMNFTFCRDISSSKFMDLSSAVFL